MQTLWEAPSLSLKTGEVSRKIQRGKHTTRHAELYPVTVGESICYIADTPGFSMIDFARFNFTDREGLPYTFREFAPLMGECRYTKCTHTKEEGCAVLERVKAGDISKCRHESYVAMLEEINKNPPWKNRILILANGGNISKAVFVLLAEHGRVNENVI